MANNTYRKAIRHDGLHKYRVITASNSYDLEQKVAAQKAQWDEQWQRKLSIARRAQNANQAVAIAKRRTDEADEVQASLSTILIDSLEHSELSFEDLKDKEVFEEPKPIHESDLAVPEQPDRNAEKYNPPLSFFARHSKRRAKIAQEENDEAFKADFDAWNKEAEKINRSNKERRERHVAALKEWDDRRASFYHRQQKANAEVDELANRFAQKDGNAVSEFFELAIDAIPFPIAFESNALCEYDSKSNALVVDFYLPALSDLPNLKKVTYIKTRNEFKETHYSESYLRKTYEHVIYQIVLRVVKCVFSAAVVDNIPETLILNGKVRSVDAATGHHVEPYILSLSTSREDFSSLNLKSIDPKAWFRSEKGISAAALAKITPVAPISRINREDKRFIEGYSVEIEEGENLGAMNWQDFENLVREIFSEEFASNGGEVKITRASRDGGVDAVAFDPDPVRGGKIIIQAKRYTNVVGVSAVRDLYGTVMNEGAMKGILVTTSSFGNDAYDFAKGKPLTLINGGELLYLLQKHGHHARIDLKEAKEILGEQTK